MIRMQASFRLARFADRYGISLFVYGTVSLVSATTEWFFFLAFMAALGPVVASVAGFFGATAINFFLSRYIVFRSERAFSRDLSLVFLASAIAFAANFLLFYALHAMFRVNPITAKLLGTVFGFAFNYIARQFYIFSRLCRFVLISELVYGTARRRESNLPVSRDATANRLNRECAPESNG